MRKFGTEAPEYLEFTIGDDEKVYKIPLLASMPIKKIEELDEANERGEGQKWQINMLREYMGDVVDDLPAGVAGDILSAWSNSTRDQGANEGES